MYPGFPSRLEKEMKQLYLTRVLGGDGSRLKVSSNLCKQCQCRRRRHVALVALCECTSIYIVGRIKLRWTQKKRLFLGLFERHV